MNLLSVKNLTHVYANGTRALKDVSFEVKDGEFLVIIGLSGSGKSTLLRAINRLIEPTSGTISWRGRDISSEPVREVRRRAGMIFQNYNLVPRTSALANVLTGRLATTSTWRSLLHRFTDAQRVLAIELLTEVGLNEKVGARADQLSGGQQQRVAIARALFQAPELLLADEPVASLDPALADEIMRLLQTANRTRRLTVICNLHFMSLVRSYATRVLALNAGQLVFDGEPHEIDDAWFKKIYGSSAKDVSHAL